MKRFIAISIILNIISLWIITVAQASPIDDVRNFRPAPSGPTLGNIVDKYKYISDSEWKLIKETDKGSIIQYTAKYSDDSILIPYRVYFGIENQIVMEDITDFLKKSDFYVRFYANFILTKKNEVTLLGGGVEYEGDDLPFVSKYHIINQMLMNKPFNITLPYKAEYKIAYLYYKYILTNTNKSDYPTFVAKMAYSKDDTTKLGSLSYTSFAPAIIVSVEGFEFDDLQNVIYLKTDNRVTNIILKNMNGFISLEQFEKNYKKYSVLQSTPLNYMYKTRVKMGDRASRNIGSLRAILQLDSPQILDFKSGDTNNYKLEITNQSPVTIRITPLDAITLNLPDTLMATLNNSITDYLSSNTNKDKDDKYFIFGNAEAVSRSNKLPKIIPGTYIYEDGGEKTRILLYFDGRGAYEYGNSSHSINWKQDKESLLIITPPEPDEDDSKEMTDTAAIISSASFVLDKMQFNLDPNSRPKSYKYVEPDYSGILSIQPRLAGWDDDPVCIKISTINNNTKGKCNLIAWCEQKNNNLFCATHPEEANHSFSITYDSDSIISVDSNSHKTGFCEKKGRFAGNYILQK